MQNQDIVSMVGICQMMTTNVVYFLINELIYY